MRLLSRVVGPVSSILYWVSCAAIVGIVGLTVVDVVLRRLGHPLDFAFEIVVFLAAIVIGFSLPRTSLEKAHVVMEFLTCKLSAKWALVMFVVTRLIGIGMFAILGGSIILYGGRLKEAGQSSAILKIPEYPIAYAVAVTCLVECFVLICQLFDTREKVSSEEVSS